MADNRADTLLKSRMDALHATARHTHQIGGLCSLTFQSETAHGFAHLQNRWRPMSTAALGEPQSVACANALVWQRV
jgi:hypothetical protein